MVPSRHDSMYNFLYNFPTSSKLVIKTSLGQNVLHCLSNTAVVSEDVRNDEDSTTTSLHVALDDVYSWMMFIDPQCPSLCIVVPLNFACFFSCSLRTN